MKSKKVKIKKKSKKQINDPKPKGDKRQDQIVEIKQGVIDPEEALRFLEDIRTLQADIDEPTVLISIRIPGNVLRALKFRAKADGKKYQSLLVEYIRFGLKKY